MRRAIFFTKSKLNWGSYWRGWNIGLNLSARNVDFTLVCPHEYPNRRIIVRDIKESFRVVSLPRVSTRTMYTGMVLRAGLGPLIWNPRDVDVVHSCAPAFPETWLPVCEARIRKVPVVVDFDDWWGLEPSGRRPLLETAVQEYLQQSAARMASLVVTVSEELAQRFGPCSQSQILDLPNGVDPNVFHGLDPGRCRTNLRSRLGISEKTILITCLFDYNFAQLYNAVAKRVDRELAGARLLVIDAPQGKGDRNTEKHGYGSAVIELGRRPRMEILEALVGSDILFFPMQETMFDRARFPIKILEFLAAGRPIVATPVGKTRRLLIAAGYPVDQSLIVNNNSAEAIIDGINFALNHPGVAEDISKSAQSYVFKELSWEKVAQKCIGVYESAMRGGRS